MAYLIGKFKNLIPIKVIKKINQATTVNDVLITKFAVNTDWIANPETRARVKNISPIPRILKTSF